MTSPTGYRTLNSTLARSVALSFGMQCAPYPGGGWGIWDGMRFRLVDWEAGIVVSPPTEPVEPSSRVLWQSVAFTIEAPDHHAEDAGQVREEDGGRAMIVELQGQAPSPLFVRLHSWDESCAHAEMRAILGRRIRVTIQDMSE